MVKRLLAVAALNISLLCVAAFAQNAEAAAIKAEAEKSSRAFMSGDLNRLLDLTYPKVIELAGGRAKLLASIEAEMKSMRDMGIKPVSYTVGEPEQSVRLGAKLLAVVPVKLKLEAASGFITQRSFLLAVSTDDGKSWTFLDGSSLNREAFKIFLPEAVDKITLPKVEEPVFERKPAG